MWVVYGIIITMVPPILAGLFGRLVLKINYYTLMGFIGGSHTDPPTLAFANTVAPEGCKLPNMGYATVYPLTMFLRIFTAQLLVLLAVVKYLHHTRNSYDNTNVEKNTSNYLNR